MTDEANVAPVDTGGAVITDAGSKPHELGSQIPDEANSRAAERRDQTEASKEAPKSNADAVKRAVEASKAKAEEAVKAKEADAKPASKAEEKQPQPRDNGKFASQKSTDEKAGDAQRAAPEGNGGDQTSEGRKPHHEAPARFLEPSKRDWSKVPESVQEEVHRALSENEKGIQKYKASAERYENLREFDDLAKKNGRDLTDTLKTVAAFEDAMQKNPLAALNFALREVGPKKPDGSPLSVDDFVEFIHGQSDDQRLQAANNEIAELRKQLNDIQTQQKAAEIERALPKFVNDFAEQNPRFDELSDTIAVLIETGTAKDLEAAYKLADTLKPASASNAEKDSQPLKPAENAPAQTQASALNPKGSKSVSGAPTGGVSPSSQKVPSSNSEAVRRAMARASA